MAEYWEIEYGKTKTIVFIIYMAMLVYAVMIFWQIPSIEYQWGQTQEMIFYVLLFETAGIYFISIFLPNILLNSEKLSERFRSAGGQTQGLMAASGQVRNVMIIVAAIGEACAVNGLVLYLLSGDTTRPFIFIVIAIAHYTITMGKLRRVRGNLEQLARMG